MDDKFNNYTKEEIEEDLAEEFGKTQEMDSLRLNQEGGEPRSITPRGEFTEMNSADDMSRTLLMDSVDNPEADYEPLPVSSNPVKRRRRKKKHTANHTRTMGQIFLGALISVVAICLGSVLAFHAIDGLRDITGIAKDNKEFDISITENMTVDEISDALEENGVILNSFFFKNYLKFTKRGQGFLVGTHTVHSNMSYGTIVDTLKTQKKYLSTVTIMFPEGSTAADVGRLLEENKVCRASDFEKVYRVKMNKYDFEEGIPDDPNRLNALEGYLWPDTYEFYVIDDLEKTPTMDTTEYARAAAVTMLKTFETKITKSMNERMEDLGMTLDEVIILASIVQREGINAENMAYISSVFHNRLNDPDNFPNLESDTTTTYINQYIRPLTNDTNADEIQKIANAYNSYDCVGLPAGAICNPGMDAINAVLNPADTDYHFFISDKEGVFYWARTLAEHEKNIQDAKLRENS